jgi:molecular chaperone DnaK
VIEQALNEAREAVKGEDAQRMRKAQDNLTRVSQMLAQAASRGGPTDTGAGPQGGAGGGQDGEVIDAEFKDADDRKA